MAVRTIATDLTLSGETEFNDAMKSVSNNLKTLKSEMKLLSAEFADNADSVEALTAKEKTLEEYSGQYIAEIDAIEAHLEHVKDAYGENSAEADKWARALNNAKADLANTIRELDKTRAALDKAAAAEKAEAEATKKAAAEKNKYVPLTDKMKSSVDKIKTSISEAREKVSSFTQKISDSAHHVPVLAEALDVLQVAGKGAFSALTAAGKGATKLGGTALKAGAAVMTATGVAAFSAAKSMISFASEAAAAAQAAADAGEQLSPVQQKWLAYSHTLTNLDESVNAAKAALGGVLLPLLGEMGDEGTQLLFQFSDAMEAAAGDPEAMGKVVTEYVAKFAEFLKERLPEIKELAREFLTGLGEGFDENGDQILDDAMDIVSALLDGIISAAPQIGIAAGHLISRLGTELAAQGPAVLEAGLQLLLGLLQGFAEGLPEFISSLPDMILQIIHTLIDLAPSFADVGKQLVQGIWNGLVNAWHGLVDGVKGLFNDLLSSVRADQEIHSPSRKWGRMVGGPMAQGIGVDFKEQMKTVRKEIEAQLDPSSFPTPGKFDIPSPPPGGVGGFGGSSNVSNRTVNGGINIVVNAAPGQSAEEIAEEVKIRMQNETETETEVFT